MNRIVMKTIDWSIYINSDSAPRELVIEISTMCNYACIHCFRNAAKNLVSCLMNRDLYMKILYEASSLGVKRIVLTGWGEPSIHPDLLFLLREAKKRGFEVALNTNGSRLVEIAEELIEMELDELFVSIDSFDVRLYSRIRRLGDLSRVVKGLLLLKDLKRRLGVSKPVVRAIFTITKLNLEDIIKAVDLAQEIGVSEIIYSYYIPLSDSDKHLDCLGDPSCREELRRIFRELSLRAFETSTRIARPSIEPAANRSCPFASNKALFIRCDGKVSPCMYYSRSWVTRIDGVKRSIREVVIGDLSREVLGDIWLRNSRLFFRLYFLSLPSCLNCELRSYCDLNFSNEYDCWGESPSCSHCPYLHLLSYCPV